MTTSSSLREARQALGQRLREIRQDAGLTARALADLAGWHESKCSRLEHGRTPPSDDDIRAWTRACMAEDQAEDLIATARGIAGMYVEWRRMERSGLRRVQESVFPLWERTRKFRAYSSWLIPGPIQSADYIFALLSSIRDWHAIPDDVEAAVQVRLRKQQFLRDGRRHFFILLEESALRYKIGGAETLRDQLLHLLDVMSLQNLRLGVIPFSGERSKFSPVEDFWLFDDAQVNVELVSAYLTITQPREIAMYADTFGQMAELAVYGDTARALITAAIDELA